MALAPSFFLVAVPSSSIMVLSMPTWSSASQPSSLGGDDVVDVLDGLQHALAEVALRVAVAQFDGFVLAGGGAGRHGRAAEDAVSRQTSASTVGLPRESRISRAHTSIIVDIVGSSLFWRVGGAAKRPQIRAEGS